RGRQVVRGHEEDVDVVDLHDLVELADRHDVLDQHNDQSLLVVLNEDIVAIGKLDEIVKVDDIDIFFVAPNDLATSMGHIGKMDHPDVQQTIDGALARIVGAGRTAGMLVNAANVERYTRLGVRALMTSFFPWIQAGLKDLTDRATAGTRGGRSSSR